MKCQLCKKEILPANNNFMVSEGKTWHITCHKKLTKRIANRKARKERRKK